MTKYPVFKRWIVRLPPEERRPYLRGFSAQLEGRLREIDSLLNRDIDHIVSSPPQEEVIDVADIPLPPVLGQPGNPIEISDDEEPHADIEDLLKDSAEEDNVQASVVTAPPFSFSDVETEGDSILEDLELSSAAVSMEVTEDALEEASDNANEDSMDNSGDALDEAVEDALEEVFENALEEAIENALEEAIENALEEAEDKAAKDSNELIEEPIATEVVQEISENVEAVDEDPTIQVVQEIPENIEAVDEVPAIDEAAQEIPEDPEALEEGPEIEDPFLPEVGLEGEDFAPLATSATKSASTEALISSGASSSYQEKPKLTIWTAIFYPAPKIFVNLRFRGNTGYHLRHTPVKDRPEEYAVWKWPPSAQIPTGKVYLILYINFSF